MIKCVAFDCFGTVFDMSDISQEEIKEYVDHVRSDNFTPHDFPPSWWNLDSHLDSRKGIVAIQLQGIKCVALSNGSVDLIYRISKQNGIHWDAIIDLVSHRVYKPHVDAYRTIEKDLGFLPSETLMVTANPKFGDVEGSAAIGMRSKVIRHGKPNTIIELAEWLRQWSLCWIGF
jgi:HAD superfamily hydrolase (TIGR01493 family)